MHPRVRRSTVVLSAIFVVTLVVYLVVRPDPRSLPARVSTPTATVPKTSPDTNSPDTTSRPPNATTTTTEPGPTTTRSRPGSTARVHKSHPTTSTAPPSTLFPPTSTSFGTSITTAPPVSETTTTG